MEMKQYLKARMCEAMATWEAPDIYAISVRPTVTAYDRNGRRMTLIDLCYNCKSNLGRLTGKYSEKRWNVAYWDDDGYVCLLDPEQDPDGQALVNEWFCAQGITDPGADEDEDAMYDTKGNYIGKGAIGFYPLLMLAAEVVRELQTEGFIREKFGEIPVIVHDLEYAWYSREATEYANPNGEAETFMTAMKKRRFF